MIGLLFVSITLRPSDIFRERSDARTRATAYSAFTSLVDAFFVSNWALVPGVNLGAPAVALAVVALAASVKLHLGERSKGAIPLMLALSLLLYGLQAAVGVEALLRDHSSAAIDRLAYLILASFALSLARAWTLLTVTPSETL